MIKDILQLVGEYLEIRDFISIKEEYGLSLTLYLKHNRFCITKKSMGYAVDIGSVELIEFIHNKKRKFPRKTINRVVGQKNLLNIFILVMGILPGGNFTDCYNSKE